MGLGKVEGGLESGLRGDEGLVGRYRILDFGFLIGENFWWDFQNSH